jgi:predicted component of type VI protein secretion system
MGLSEFKITNIKYNPMGNAVWMELDIFEGPARQNTVQVTGEGLSIGRDAENGYSIREDSQMSSFHAKVTLEDGQFVLKDLGSTNRTWIRLSPEGDKSSHWPIVVGDIIKIGSTVFLAQDPNLSQLALPTPQPQVQPDGAPKTEDATCKICYSRDCNAAFYPCGHMSCEYCAQ